MRSALVMTSQYFIPALAGACHHVGIMELYCITAFAKKACQIGRIRSLYILIHSTDINCILYIKRGLYTLYQYYIEVRHTFVINAVYILYISTMYTIKVLYTFIPA